MKTKLLIWFMFFLSVFILNHVHIKANNLNLLGKEIYIDPGHGGRDSGAIYKNIYEKDINLIMSQKIAKHLVAKGAIVYLTRETDIDLSTSTTNKKRSDLSNRAKMINDSRADMYISIHLNYINSAKWQGLQIFYNNKHNDNEKIANSLTNFLKQKSSNIREPKKENIYYMYKQIKIPGVLIELGFLSNANDRYRLTRAKYQENLAIDIANAIESYFLTN